MIAKINYLFEKQVVNFKNNKIQTFCYICNLIVLSIHKNHLLTNFSKNEERYLNTNFRCALLLFLFQGLVNSSIFAKIIHKNAENNHRH